jgi:hypothetical protein
MLKNEGHQIAILQHESKKPFHFVVEKAFTKIYNNFSFFLVEDLVLFHGEKMSVHRIIIEGLLNNCFFTVRLATKSM